MKNCDTCKYSKWVGVDGYGNYCSNENTKMNLVYGNDICDLWENDIVDNPIGDLISNSKDLDPEIAKLIDDNIFELLD